MSRCSLCPGINTCVAVDGPPSDVEFLGDSPNWEDSKKGFPFAGKPGREFREHYLPLANLKPDRVRIDNAISCLPDRPKGKLDLNKEADRDLLNCCVGYHLLPRLAATPPKVIVPMGTFACYAIDPEIDLEIHHGMPMQTRLGITAFPMYHPSGGIFEPKKMLQIRTDWYRLRLFLAGKLQVAVDQYPEPDYMEVTDIKELSLLDPTMPMACDTEASRRLGPYCLTYSQVPGTGRLIKADRPDLLAAFQNRITKWEDIILFHNWLYDWNVTEDMGLTFPFKSIRDTMVTAYHLGNVPQGLKTLAYRLLGMEMQSFEDLVKPYSSEIVLNYYRWAQTFEWPKPEEQLVIDDKTGKFKTYKPQSMSTKFKRFFTDFSKNAEKDVFKMFEENWVEWQESIEERCGPYPGMDVRHAPDEEVLFYACRDSDATLRLWPELQRMKDNARLGKLQEQW